MQRYARITQRWLVAVAVVIVGTALVSRAVGWIEDGPFLIITGASIWATFSTIDRHRMAILTSEAAERRHHDLLDAVRTTATVAPPSDPD